MAAVARRLGVAPATLRTWDRRYGLGPSEHLAGSHRRYSSADLGRLLVMRRLTLEGVAPSEAARAALASDPAGQEPSIGSGAVEPSGAPTGPSLADVMNAYSDAVPMAADPAALAAAAEHFDNAAVRWQLSRVHPRDTLAWYSGLVEPALRMLADRTVLAGPGENPGPALVAAAFAELRSRSAVVAARLADPRGVRPPRATTDLAGADAVPDAAPLRTVLAVGTTAPDLTVHVLCAALLEQGIDAQILSSPVPGALVATVGQVEPDAVVIPLGGEPEGTPHAEQVHAALLALVQEHPELPVFVHLEPGRQADLPMTPALHRVRSLTGALHEIVAVVR